MSRRPSPESRSRRSSGAAQAPLKKARAVVAVALAALVGGAGLWFFTSARTGLPMPPVATASLDAASVSLIEKLQAEVRRQPESATAWARLGMALRSFEFRDAAGQCLEHAEHLDSTNPRWPHLRGLLLAPHARPDAIAALRRATDLCGNEPPVSRLRLARLLAESGQWEEARREFAELVRTKPDHAPALLGLAQGAQVRGEFREALTLAMRCTNDRSTARAAWSLVGALQQRLGDTNAARLASLRAAALPVDSAITDPFESEFSPSRSDARDLSDRAQRFLQAGQLAEAGPLAEQLTREHPQFAESWLVLGRWRLLSRNASSAEAALRRHLELEPASVNGVFQLGSALLAQNRFADAAAAFEQATRLKADFGPAFYNLGFALARAGQTRAAVAPFREAIRHNPERVDAYVLLADLHAQLGEFDTAAELARQAEAIQPTDRRLPALREKIMRR